MDDNMLFSQINPKVRYARYLNLDDNSLYREVVPLDARLFYTISGKGTIKVKNKEYEMTQYSLLIINSGIPYEIQKPDGEICFAAINFDYTQNSADKVLPITPVSPDNFTPDMLLDRVVFDDVRELSEVLYINRIDILPKKLNAIITEYTQKLLYYENKTGHILAE